MMKRLKRIIASCLTVAMALSLVIPSASAVSYNGSSSYQSGKYYKKLTNVQLTGNQREDIINVARSQVGYQESSSSSQLSGTVKGSKNYTEYGRWFGMQDMWCAMFVSWCAHVAGIPTSIVPSHSYTPTGLSWFRNRGQAYSRYTVANGGYTPEPGDIIYFKSSRNNNTTNHIGIVTGYSNGTVYTIEGNTSSATISTDGGAVCEKSYSIQNTYIVYICRPEYKNTAKPKPANWLTGEVKDIVFDAVYYADHHPDLRSQYGTDADALFDYFLNQGIQAGHQASPTFDIRYYVENNEDIRATYGTDYVAAMKHFVSTGINEARVTAEPLDLGNSFQARISFPAAGLNFSLSDTNVITYNPSDSPAQVWTFERHPAGAYRIINSKNGYSLAVDGYDSECNVHIAEYRDSRRQLWYIYEREDGRYVFRSMASSCCVIDVYGGVMTPSTNVWSYTYNGTDAQLLGIEKLSGLAQMSPVDLGTGFYAKINASDGMNLSLEDENVIIYSDSDALAQVWRFDRQSDGSYEIVNQKNGLLLDTYWAKGTSDTNVQIYQDHDNIAQRWFVYQTEGGYVFRPACSQTCVLDVTGNGTAAMTNVRTYVYNGSDAQTFQLISVPPVVNFDAPVQLGADFYANINLSSGMSLSLQDTNVIIDNASAAPAQVWRFALQSDGSYYIVNQENEMLLDVYWAKDESGTNVQVYPNNNSIAHKWFIYQSGDKYVFRPAFSETRVLNVAGNSMAPETNVEIYDFTGAEGQRFDIQILDHYVNLNRPLDLGTDFYAKINASGGMNLSLIDENVIIYPDNTEAAQVWQFVRQDNGSYHIINQKNGKLLDVYWAKDESGTNVQVYEDNDSIAHKWFIYQSGNKYVFRPACSETRVLNVAGNSMAPETNVEIHELTGAEGQRFDIQILDQYVDLNRPLDLGTDFYAKINASDGMNLSLIDENVIIYHASTAPAQVWKFVRQDNGSYHIINQKNSKLLDVYWAKDESGTNVQVYEDNDSIAHKWFIYQSGDKYVFRPACSETRVLNVAGNSMAPETNVEIHELTGVSGQRFGIQRLEDYADLGLPLDLGTDFYAKINASDGMNLSLEDENVIIYPDSTAPAQVWKFLRQDNGSYQIVNQKNSLLLTVAGGVDASCTNVLIAPADGSDAQKWYIYQSGEQYVLRPACSYSRVLDVYGDYTDPMTNVEIYTFHDSEAHKFRLLIQENYTEGLSDANMAVLRTIMYAVETGGQVYGQADYSDFTEAYTNTSQEHAITIGAGQWYGPEAKELLNRIRQADPSGFAALDTAGIASDLDSKDWSTYQLSKGSAKAKCIQAIISTDVGKRCQDQMMDEQLTKFMQEAADLGVTDQLAQMMCANIRHLGGLSAVKRILAKTEQPYTIHTIYAALLTDTGSNQVGTFRSRNKMVYESLLANFS